MSDLPFEMVRDRRFGDATLKRVLERCAWYADKDGHSVRPAVETLADDCEIHVRTVQRVLRKAEELGLLVLLEEARRHAPRVYRIDLDRLADYPLTETGEMRDRRRRRRAPAAEETAGSRGDTTPPLSAEAAEGRGGDASARGGTESVRGGAVPPNRVIKGDKKGNPRAREAAHPDGPASARAGGASGGVGGAAAASGAPSEAQPEPEPSLMARWKRLWPELEAEPAWPVIRRCVPDADDGETLTLAVESPGVGWAVLLLGKLALEVVCERRIEIVVRPWVELRLVELGLMHAGQASASGHVANNLEITLEGRTWALWCAGRERDPDGPWEACWPDGIQGDKLRLVPRSVDWRMRLEDSRARLEQALGVAVKPVWGNWIDAVMDALAACRAAAKARGEPVPLGDAAFDKAREAA